MRKDQFWISKQFSTNFLHLQNTVTMWPHGAVLSLICRFTDGPVCWNFPRGCQDGIKMKTYTVMCVKHSLAKPKAHPTQRKTKLWNDTRTRTIQHYSQTGKTQKQPTCPSAEQGAKKMWCFYREACSDIKRTNNTSSTVDATRDDYPKRNTSEWENKHHTISFVCGIWSTTQKSLPMRQKRPRRGEQTCGCQRGGDWG